MYSGTMNNTKRCYRCRAHKHKLLFMTNEYYCEKCYSKGFKNAINSIGLPLSEILHRPDLIEAKMYQSLIKNHK